MDATNDIISNSKLDADKLSPGPGGGGVGGRGGGGGGGRGGGGGGGRDTTPLFFKPPIPPKTSASVLVLDVPEISVAQRIDGLQNRFERVGVGGGERVS